MRVPERPQKNLPDEAKASMRDALDGGAEFFILAVLDYENQPKTGIELPKPRSISIRLFKTEPYRFLFSQEYTPRAEVHTTDKDDMVNAMSAARLIATHLKD
jgi:hypothetical protein